MKKLYSIIILSLIALGNAIYLTISAYKLKAELALGSETTKFFCDINSQVSCSSVFSESFSRIFGIPFSLLAMIVYPILIIVAILGIFKKTNKHFLILFILGIGGILFNSYIIVNEYQIGVYCLACLVCSFIIITNTILAGVGLKTK